MSASEILCLARTRLLALAASPLPVLTESLSVGSFEPVSTPFCSFPILHLQSFEKDCLFLFIMSASLPSDEVAEDYKGSLEDLVTNDRYQISNLTLIAKENIEHAEAISRVLQNHINRVCLFIPSFPF